VKRVLQIGIIVLLLLCLVNVIGATPVTYRDGDRLITYDEEAGTVTIEPYYSLSDRFLSFFTVFNQPTLTVYGTTKENVGEFYRIAKHNSWSSYYIRSNQMRAYRRDKGHCGYYDWSGMDNCLSSAVHTFIDGSCLSWRTKCDDLSSAEKSTFSALGFSLRDQCFYCYEYPGSGGSGYRYCLIRVGDRDLTESEMWFPELKQRAIDLGYTIRAAPYEASIEGDMNWGIFGTEKANSYDNFNMFTKEAELRGYSASRYDVSGGYVWCFGSIEASSMAAITQPVPEPTPSPTVQPTATPTLSPTPELTPTLSPTPSTPGFESIFAILGILVVVYAYWKRKNQLGGDKP